MPEHWHLYCDEAGTFETIGRKRSLIAGLLVPDSKKTRLADEFENLKRKHGILESFVHYKDLHKRAGFKPFQEELVALTRASSVRVVVMRYDEDTLAQLPESLTEAFACNRYVYMIQGLIEHILYYDPRNYGKHIEFSLHPNSRVFPCDERDVAMMQSLGFRAFKPKNKDRFLVHVWSKTGLRVFANRLQLEHRSYSEIVGTRTFQAIEMPVAERSKDAFVHWVDVIAGTLMWEPKSKNTKKLKKHLYIDLSYGPEEDRCKGLCRLFFGGNPKDFIVRYLHDIGSFKKNYYKRQLTHLFNRKLDTFQLLGTKDLFELEALADEHLRSSSGNWEFVKTMVEKIVGSVSALPEETRLRKDIQILAFRLLNHQLSYHNHRGEYLPAWEVISRIDQLAVSPETMEQWQEVIATRNRQSVTAANLFAFEYSNRILSDALDALERLNQCATECSGLKLKDPLLGKVRGTFAQNLAFMAPIRPDLFPAAEAQFLKAKAEFSRPMDIMRQNVYLAHLYMDWGKNDKVLAAWDELRADPAVERFADTPNADSARYMQFMLALMLKLFYVTSKLDEKLISIFSVPAVQEWFGQSANEHPFEFVFGYLGRMACRIGRQGLADSYFSAALNIPSEGLKDDQVTLQTIRAQYLVVWAIEKQKIDQANLAMEKLDQALKIMTAIAGQPYCEPIIKIENDTATAGWFKDGYNGLQRSIESGTVDEDNCKEFLRRFTFNYR